ncbi:flagellar biosynthesis protein FlhA [Parendozoicomonas haliclonae]|uniref:Flagellar biosynthesis protein FlhA n=1 Tax=Parendozoicomonas haliclonae TaxID=1960125 RepID=A0A1X7AH01_9GAMM|nr:flagellar biosynthesis protein FlhA [Parendozoicomonas haliclonae]SMA39931.1 Flagellar biosynthesis protein FlhA [Parendozoicomonas haliclonae]
MAEQAAAKASPLASIGKLQIGIPIMVLILMAMVTLPMPALLLDMFFTFNIALSLLVLLVSIYARRPLDFAVFPTLLLVATLLRLALNVASTRVVLLQGYNGSDAAGKVIQAFGEVVIGNSYVVGIVVFAILVIINFVVVTKGAGRISEVSARFTLDALPGKQMAIDADLNAGLINQEEALSRRKQVTSEADFYGAMDGASKFVRGDAVAGLLILAINIIGGLMIGTMKYQMAFGDAFNVFSLLTIGDGLVAQIPSLLLSTAAAIMVTRVSETAEMGEQITSQLFASPRALSVTAGVILIMGIVPGMPHFAFLSLGSAMAGAAWWIHKRNIAANKQEPVEPAAAAAPTTESPLTWEDVPSIDPLGLEVGFRLIAMVDKKQGGQMLGQIKGIRKNLSARLGFLIPSVRIRDNLSLSANGYSISLQGVSVAEGQVEPDKMLAINPGQVYGDLEGLPSKDPAYGLDAIWIDGELQEQASSLGYTVVDAETVIATHISKVIEDSASELLGHDEVQQLLENLGKQSPKMAEELVPKRLSVSLLQQVLRELLNERVSISDIRTIANTLLATDENIKDPLLLSGRIREALRRSIVQNLIGSQKEMPVVTLDERLEELLLKAQQQAIQNGKTSPDAVALEPNISNQLQANLPEVTRQMQNDGKQPIIIVAPLLRPLLARYARLCTDGLQVLSFNEIPENRDVQIIGKVG